MSETIRNSNKKKIPWFTIYLLMMAFILYLSIIIPYEIIKDISRNYGCTHHTTGGREADGILWMRGRALGFTAIIWFIISSFQGIFMNKHAKLFRKKRKARDLHCISSFLCIFFAFIHVYFLFISEPWRSIFLGLDRAHYSTNIFQLKIQTGIIFAVIMTSVSILSIITRKPKYMKKIGYKRFRIIHWIMMIFTIVLIFHIIYINTELWIMGYGRFY
jgi:predicted ferric reductase